MNNLIEKISKLNESEVLHFTILNNPYDHFFVRKAGKGYKFINPYASSGYIWVTDEELPQFIRDNTADGIGKIELITELPDGLDWETESDYC